MVCVVKQHDTCAALHVLLSKLPLLLLLLLRAARALLPRQRLLSRWRMTMTLDQR
jgi:hypothetical protein